MVPRNSFFRLESLLALGLFGFIILMSWIPYSFVLLYGAGIAFFTLSVLYKLKNRPHFDPWVSCEAVAVDYLSQKKGVDIARHDTFIYMPVMIYQTAEGGQIRAGFPVAKASKQYTIGKRYHIRYNPRDPEQFCFIGREDEYERLCYDGSFTILGVLCMIAGTFWLLLQVCPTP